MGASSWKGLISETIEKHLKNLVKEPTSFKNPNKLSCIDPEVAPKVSKIQKLWRQGGQIFIE